MILLPEHIRARRRKGVIRLLYALEEHVSLAETLISVHEDHRDKSRAVLREALGDCEMLGYDFKLVRGLSAVLEDRCVYESLAVVNPMKAREAVFDEAGRRVVATEEERKRAMAAAAFRLGVSTMDLERSLYADLVDEQVLTDFERVSPLDLIKEYNFALTVGLLAHVRRLELSYEGVDRDIEDAAAKLGSSTVSKSRRGSKVVSEWRPTSRIGYKAMYLEVVLGRLLSHGGWGLSADVVYPLKSGKEYRFEVSGSVHGGMMKPGFVREGLVSLEKPSRGDVAPRPRGEVVVVADVARRLRITEDEVMEMYRDWGLVDMGGVLFMEEKRDEIVEALEGASDLRFRAIRALLRDLGVKSPVPVLEALGYVVEWNRDRDESLVYRLGRRKH